MAKVDPVISKMAAKLGSLGGKARVSKGIAMHHDIIAKGRAVRWRNHYAGENALHGTPIPPKWADAVAAMTPKERKAASEAAKKRAAKKGGQ